MNMDNRADTPSARLTQQKGNEMEQRNEEGKTLVEVSIFVVIVGIAAGLALQVAPELIDRIKNILALQNQIYTQTTKK